jgi:hypothetical protein
MGDAALHEGDGHTVRCFAVVVAENHGDANLSRSDDVTGKTLDSHGPLPRPGQKEVYLYIRSRVKHRSFFLAPGNGLGHHESPHMLVTLAAGS